MIRGRMQSLETDFNQRLSDQGMTLEQYASMSGLTRETFDAEIARDADQQVREDLALEALFRALDFEVTDAELAEEFEELAQSSKSTVDEVRKKWQDMGLTAVIAESIMHRRAVGWLMENVATVEVEGTSESEADEPFAAPSAPTAVAADEPAPAAEPAAAVAVDEPAPVDDES